MPMLFTSQLLCNIVEQETVEDGKDRKIVNTKVINTMEIYGTCYASVTFGFGQHFGRGRRRFLPMSENWQ